MLTFARSPSLAWLERPADNREVLSSNLKGTTHLLPLFLEKVIRAGSNVLFSSQTCRAYADA